MMGGTADGGQTMGQDALSDLVSVLEAAQAVGVMDSTVYSWIKSGRLTAQSSPQGRRVSLAAVQALVAPPDPDAPADAVAIHEAMRLAEVSRTTIAAWLKRGRLPSWQGRHGRLVRVADVRAVALSPAAGDDPLLPTDALLIREAARRSGLSRERLYTWTKQGLLPVWLAPGRGRRVRLADVTALAERLGRGLPLKPGGAP